MQKALAWVAASGGVSVPDPVDRRYLRVTCGAGHRWRPTVYSLAQRHWCAACYGNAPLTLEDMQKNCRKPRGAMHFKRVPWACGPLNLALFVWPRVGCHAK